MSIHEKTRKRLEETEAARQLMRVIRRQRLDKMNQQTKELRRLKKLGLKPEHTKIIYPSQERG